MTIQKRYRGHQARKRVQRRREEMARQKEEDEEEEEDELEAMRKRLARERERMQAVSAGCGWRTHCKGREQEGQERRIAIAEWQRRAIDRGSARCASLMNAPLCLARP